MAAIPAFSGDIQDFAAGVSDKRVTINPSTAAAIDRFHFQWTSFNYESANIVYPFNNQLLVNNEEATLLAPDQSTPVDSVYYDTGFVSGLKTTFIWPFQRFSLGIEGSIRQENYSKERNFQVDLGDEERTLLESDTNKSATRAEFRTQTNSFIVGVPFRHFALGVRYNVASNIKTIERLNFGGIRALDTGVTVLGDDNDLVTGQNVQGQASYTFLEYGVFVPQLFWGIDVAYFYRFPISGTFKIDGFEVTNAAGDEASFADINFIEPSLSIFGFGYTFFFRNKRQVSVLLEFGGYGDNEVDSIDAQVKGLTEEEIEELNSGVSGLLLQYKKGDFEATWGNRTEIVAGSKTERSTLGFQLPVPFFVEEGSTVTIGQLVVRLFDEYENQVAESTSYSFSANIKWGESHRSSERCKNPDRSSSKVIVCND